eukprot:6190695-Pleurochrysis_carterae.AAC.3
MGRGGRGGRRGRGGIVVACRILRAPSKEKGLVTTPTVSAPAALAHSATIGAAPEPVPPPLHSDHRSKRRRRWCDLRTNPKMFTSLGKNGNAGASLGRASNRDAWQQFRQSCT